METYRLVHCEPFDMAHDDDWNLVSRTVNSGTSTGFRGTITAEGKQAGVTGLAQEARLFMGGRNAPDAG